MKRFQHTPVYFGLLMLAGFISFFFVMKALGLYTTLELRFLNLLIHGSLIFWAMKTWNEHRSEAFRWGPAAMVGVRASLVGVLGFAIFQALYLQFIEPEFLTYIQENAILGEYLTPWNASLVLVGEGLAATMLFTYLSVRYIDDQTDNVHNVAAPERS